MLSNKYDPKTSHGLHLAIRGYSRTHLDHQIIKLLKESEVQNINDRHFPKGFQHQLFLNIEACKTFLRICRMHRKHLAVIYFGFEAYKTFVHICRMRRKHLAVIYLGFDQFLNKHN